MSSTEPPSRIHKGQDPNAKSTQDGLSSKGKVEKVREVDADEQTRQRKKFRMMMGDEDQATDVDTGNAAPSPFELFSDVAESETPRSSFGHVQDAIVASPSYSSPPNISVDAQAQKKEDQSITKALPQAKSFWTDVDPFSLQPPKPQQYTETAKSAANPFGPPGKPIEVKNQMLKTPKQELSSPFEQAVKIASPKPALRYFAPSTKKPLQEAKRDFQESSNAPFLFVHLAGGSGQPPEKKIIEIEAPSLPLLPTEVQPMAFAATTIAAPNLAPQTVSLFFQMIGQIYVMVSPPGISTTELVLNNPAYADSKFYGATITIEKYATAPDSFNIRLTGSETAVVSFRDNIPSLMNAFQRGNLPFKIHRIDAEYTIEKPLFRRKNRGGSKGEAGGGDMRERK